MKRVYFALPLLLVLLVVSPGRGATDNPAKETEAELSTEDLEILQLMELLEMLDLLDNMEEVAALEDDQ